MKFLRVLGDEFEVVEAETWWKARDMSCRWLRDRWGLKDLPLTTFKVFLNIIPLTKLDSKEIKSRLYGIGKSKRSHKDPESKKLR